MRRLSLRPAITMKGRTFKGQIGRRIARWCAALGSEVAAFDPFVPDAVFVESSAQRVDMDALVDTAEVVFVAVPPTPSAKHLLSRERIGRLRKGALVVVITRAHAVDMAALRERILANELAGAFDVYDVETNFNPLRVFGERK